MKEGHQDMHYSALPPHHLHLAPPTSTSHPPPPVTPPPPPSPRHHPSTTAITSPPPPPLPPYPASPIPPPWPRAAPVRPHLLTAFHNIYCPFSVDSHDGFCRLNNPSHIELSWDWPVTQRQQLPLLLVLIE